MLLNFSSILHTAYTNFGLVEFFSSVEENGSFSPMSLVCETVNTDFPKVVNTHIHAYTPIVCSSRLPTAERLFLRFSGRFFLSLEKDPQSLLGPKSTWCAIDGREGKKNPNKRGLGCFWCDVLSDRRQQPPDRWNIYPYPRVATTTCGSISFSYLQGYLLNGWLQRAVSICFVFGPVPFCLSPFFSKITCPGKPFSQWEKKGGRNNANRSSKRAHKSPRWCFLFIAKESFIKNSMAIQFAINFAKTLARASRAQERNTRRG